MNRRYGILGAMGMDALEQLRAQRAKERALAAARELPPIEGDTGNPEDYAVHLGYEPGLEPPMIDPTELYPGGLLKAGAMKAMIAAGMMKGAGRDAILGAVGKGGVHPDLRSVAQQISRGEAGAADYAATLKRLDYEARPYTPDTLPPPADEETIRKAVGKGKADQVFAARGIPEGTPVHLRLDVPAQENHGVWVPTIHAADRKVVGYDSYANVTNPTFHLPQSTSLKIANGEKNKEPFSWIKGNYKPTTPEAAYERARQLMNDPEWVQVGMNPRKHSYFFDRANPERPILGGDEALQVGPLIMVKNPKYGSISDYKYAMGGPVSINPYHRHR